MARPRGKRADNDAATAKKLQQLRTRRIIMRLTMKEIAEAAGASESSVEQLFSDTEASKRYHTEMQINRALKAVDKIEREMIKKLKK